MPNLLTLGRLVLVPFQAVLFAEGGNTLELALMWCYTIVSDLLDGYLARTWKVASLLGRVLDAGADKTVTLVIGYCLWQFRGLPDWAFGFLVVYGGPVTLMGLWKIWSKRPVPPPRRLGRASVFVWALVGMVYILEASWADWTAAAALLLSGVAVGDYCRAKNWERE